MFQGRHRTVLLAVSRFNNLWDYTEAYSGYFTILSTQFKKFSSKVDLYYSRPAPYLLFYTKSL